MENARTKESPRRARVFRCRRPVPNLSARYFTYEKTILNQESIDAKSDYIISSVHQRWEIEDFAGY